MANNSLYKLHMDTDFSVQHTVSTNWVMKDFHFHDTFEIYCTLSEGVRYFVKDRVFHLRKGDVMIFNNMDLHKSLVPVDMVYERYIVLFNPSYIQGLSTENTDLLECFLSRGHDFPYVVHPEQQQLATFLQLLEKARGYCDNAAYGADIYRKIVLGEILLLINNMYRTAELPGNISHEGEYKKIRPVIQYIHGNISKDLSLDKLAESFFISKHHLGFLFKKATGFTVNEYIINCRIIKARELLKSGMTVTETAERSGFSSLSHFIRTFKTYTGKSPKKYALS